MIEQVYQDQLLTLLVFSLLFFFFFHNCKCKIGVTIRKRLFDLWIIWNTVPHIWSSLYKAIIQIKQPCYGTKFFAEKITPLIVLYPPHGPQPKKKERKGTCELFSEISCPVTLAYCFEKGIFIYRKLIRNDKYLCIYPKINS